MSDSEGVPCLSASDENDFATTLTHADAPFASYASSAALRCTRRSMLAAAATPSCSSSSFENKSPSEPASNFCVHARPVVLRAARLATWSAAAVDAAGAVPDARLHAAAAAAAAAARGIGIVDNGYGKGKAASTTALSSGTEANGAKELDDDDEDDPATAEELDDDDNDPAIATPVVCLACEPRAKVLLLLYLLFLLLFCEPLDESAFEPLESAF